MKRDETINLIYYAIGFNIKRLREQSGQSQGDFAKMVGMNRSYLNQIEQGKQNASIKLLAKIADGLDTPLTDLLTGLESNPPHRLSSDTVYAVVQMPRPTDEQ